MEAKMPRSWWFLLMIVIVVVASSNADSARKSLSKARYVPLNSLTLRDMMKKAKIKEDENDVKRGTNTTDDDEASTTSHHKQWWHLLNKGNDLSSKMDKNSSKNAIKLTSGLINRFVNGAVLRPKPARLSVLISDLKPSQQHPAPAKRDSSIQYSASLPKKVVNKTNDEKEKDEEMRTNMPELSLQTMRPQMTTSTTTTSQTTLRTTKTTTTTDSKREKIPFGQFLKEISSTAAMTSASPQSLSSASTESLMPLSTWSSSSSSPTSTIPTLMPLSTWTNEDKSPSSSTRRTESLEMKAKDNVSMEDESRMDLITLIKDKLEAMISTNKRILSTLQSQSRLQKDLLRTLTELKEEFD